MQIIITPRLVLTTRSLPVALCVSAGSASSYPSPLSSRLRLRT